ncbi:MAG: alpha-glucan family phosphorylase, partial [Methanobacteriota archaeon]
PVNVLAGGTLLDPNALTIGFARRFATYKRADLIFSDPDRLKQILNNRWMPVQILFAGKAHPADDPAKRILQRIYQSALRPEFGGRIAFVEDYGEQIAQYMVHGVDLWLNTPLPSMEASGTSGMKASLNGVLHMSVPTGWWLEGYNGQNGWMIGDEHSLGESDRDVAGKIYDLLEKEIVPMYYTVSKDGTPHLWIQKMKDAIKSNAPRFSARRMVKEYVDRAYIPAIRHCGERCVVRH